ncbi:MAG: hypothetical protein J4F35_03165 [Candidatus Latescibacteria bacterium]|nr:hypothetical protein [Candidatus Latescibacterota bacterium]
MANRRQSRRQTGRSLVREQNSRSESKHLVVQSPSGTRDRWAVAAAGCAGVLFAFVFFKNAWLCDDFWIIARQVEQLFSGNGLRWNPHERIQLFTSVMGFFLTAFGRLFATDYFVNFAVQAVILNGIVLALLALLLKTPAKWTTAMLVLTASNSYMDFTWSGLHNPFGYATLVGFLIFWQQLRHGQEAPATGKALLALAALAGLAPLFRYDFALIVWPPLFYALWEMRRACPRRVLVSAVVLLLLPLAAWTAFSLLYFGFPLPMTAYNKLGSGLSRVVSIQNGLHYYLFTLRNDPPVLPIIFAALVWLVSRNGASRALALGATLHLLYTLYTGADYMGGRFFTYPYLLAVIVLVDHWEEITTTIRSGFAGRKSAQPRRRNRKRQSRASLPAPPVAWWQSAPVPAAFAVLWMVALPHTPLMSPLSYHKVDPTEAGGISDERAAYHRGTSIMDYIAFRRGDAEIYPDHPSARLGKIIARSQVPVIHLCDMGMAPFFARTDQKLIDVYGYSDVLQARLPGLNSRPSHIMRRLPDGYLESIAANEARITDGQLNRYYEQLRLVTQSENLFADGRLKAILTVNLQKPPTAHINWPPISGGLRLPMLCYAKHRPNVLAYLRENIEKLTATELNHSSLSPSTGQ